MYPTVSTEPVRFCLISDDELIISIVRLGCPEPCEIEVFSFEGLVNKQIELSERGQAIVEASQHADAVLVTWQLDRAPLINTIGFHIRKALAGPVIALCNGSYHDEVAALAAGADHAITVPVFQSMLQAIVISYRRLTYASQNSDTEARSVIATPAETESDSRLREFGRLRLDTRSHRFFIDEKEVVLTPREYALISYLIEHPEEALARDQILTEVWGINFETGTNMVDVYMYFLRRKLESNGLKGMIETIRGFGYRLSRI